MLLVVLAFISSATENNPALSATLLGALVVAVLAIAVYVIGQNVSSRRGFSRALGELGIDVIAHGRIQQYTSAPGDEPPGLFYDAEVLVGISEDAAWVTNRDEFLTFPAPVIATAGEAMTRDYGTVLITGGGAAVRVSFKPPGPSAQQDLAVEAAAQADSVVRLLHERLAV